MGALTIKGLLGKLGYVYMVGKLGFLPAIS